MHHPVFKGTTLLVSTALIVFFSAAVHAQDAPPGLTNLTCPVKLGEAVDPAEHTEYLGRRVYFCCDQCLSRFKADPARYADRLARLMPAPGAHGAHDGTGGTGGTGAAGASGHGGVANIITTGATPRPQAGGAALFVGGGGDDDGGEGHLEHEVKADAPFLARLVNWVGKFHPPTTHFPIGLLIAAALAEFLFMKTRRPLFDHAARFCVWVGAGGALAAVTLGWFYAGFRLVDEDWIMTSHRWLGTSVALLSLAVAWLSFASHRGDRVRCRAAYRAALFLTVALVSAAGFLGGAMVYGIDHYAW
jgi:uncharacterized membrane protein/YHS domain-containing protein